MFVGFLRRAIEVVCPQPSSPKLGLNFVKLDPSLEKIPERVLKEDYEVVNNRIVRKEVQKVAMVTSFGTNCGMSTYAGYLIDEMRKLGKEVRIFAELASDAPEDPTVVRCWDRAKGIYHTAIKEVINFAPDIVYIQHEYGSLGNAAEWNLLVGHLSALFRTVVVLHSVYDHDDKLIFESPCEEIIVHSLHARELLKKRGVTHCPIHYVPHGCMGPKQMSLNYSTTKDKNILFQFGFGFEYKGWTNVPNVLDKLKEKLADVVYIGVFNMSKFHISFHESYYRKLMHDIVNRDLEGHMVLHKGFRPENVLFSYMKQARVNIFPYWNHPDWLVHGASGAVRLALASGTPTIVGNVPFFYEFKGYLPVCSTVDEYVNEIELILKDKAYSDQIKARMATFIEERSWDKVAKWYLSVTRDEDFTSPAGVSG